MTDEERMGDDALRYVDVLLTEALARGRGVGAAAPARARRHRWVAAALLLLGVGTVLGALWVDRGDRRPTDDFAAPLQDPQPDAAAGGESAVGDLHDVARRQAVWNEVVRVEVEAVRFVGIFESLSWPGARTTVAAPLEVAAFVRSFAATVGQKQFPMGGSSFPLTSATMRIRLRLRDGRQIEAIADAAVDAGNRPSLQFSSWDGFSIDDGAFAARLRELEAAAVGNPAITHAWARGDGDLRLLPATVTELTWQGPAEPAADALRRFTALQALTILPNYSAKSARSGDLVDRCLLLPSLRHVGLPARGLDDAALTRLAALPNLESLMLIGANDDLSFAAIARLGPRLTSLRVADRRLDLDDLRRIAEWPRLRELWFSVADGEESAVGEVLVRFPEVRRLALTGFVATPWAPGARRDVSALLHRLVATRIEKLQLSGCQADAPAWHALAGLTTLRQLDVRTSVDTVALAALPQFRQLTRLDVTDVTMTAVIAAGLRAALPGCVVIAGQGTVGFPGDPVDTMWPSWTR